MRDPTRQRHQQWQLDELLFRYPDLRIEPSSDSTLLLKGSIAFRVIGPAGAVVEDSYQVELQISPQFPAIVPIAYESDGRIPRDYHKLVGNSLCLGAPTALRIRLALSPSLVTFVDEFLIPYLAGHSHFSRTGTMLFGELSHGDQGIREYLAELFHSRSSTRAEEFVRLASLKKRNANKLPCPCGSGRRLGKCHNRIVNAHRRTLGRTWFVAEYDRIDRQLSQPVDRVRRRPRSRIR